MLHIILMILKIIGLVILVVLGLLLLILITVLLVPVRYRVTVEHGDKLYVDGKASWLLHFLYASFSHIEGNFHIRIKILWFTLFDNLKPGILNKASEKKDKPVKKKKVRSKKRKPEFDNDKKDTESVQRLQENSSFTQADQRMDNQLISEPENVEEIRIGEENTDWSDHEKTNLSEDQPRIYKKESFIRKLINKIKSIYYKVTAFFTGLKSKIIKWIETIRDYKNKLSLISDFIEDEINREGFKVTISSLKKLLRHIKPTKLKSRIVFGTGDPCSTGQALGALGILYSFYGDNVQIIPDFENEVLEGRHYARGRIRLVTILIIVIKLILNKRFKQLKSNIQILKEAL